MSNNEVMDEPRESTEGEYRVGITFNPSKDPRVDAIKRAAADQIDFILACGGDLRMSDLACTYIETGTMYAVKLVTQPQRV
jgi:hypothetical protein